jgi:hypothetical protein
MGSCEGDIVAYDADIVHVAVVQVHPFQAAFIIKQRVAAHVPGRGSKCSSDSDNKQLNG